MITFINAHGAIHTTSKELYKESYSHCRKITKAQAAKLGKLAQDVTELAEIRLTAVDSEGNPDNKARSDAARKMQEAKAAEAEFRKELVGDED